MKMRMGLCVLILSATVTAQTTLPAKPYTEWTLTEVLRILFNSPWSQDNSAFAFTPRYRSDSPDFPSGTNFSLNIRLYSALPVRQAIVRRMQLTIPYEKLKAAQRASFDAEIDGLLKCSPCAQYYIVTLSSSSKDRLNLISRGEAFTLDVVGSIKRIPEAELPAHISILKDTGERRNAARVVFTGRNEIVLLFRRFDDQGNPLIKPADKKFYVDFDEYISKKVEGLKKFEFDVKGLVHGGEVIF